MTKINESTHNFEILDIRWAELTAGTYQGQWPPQGITLATLRDWEAERKLPPTNKEGLKYDQGKARYDLFPTEAMGALAAVFTAGAAKYEDRNWEKGMDWGRVFAALMRHAWAWLRGERYDPESGLPHMAHVAWGAFVLITFEERKIGKDSRNVSSPQG